MEPIRILYEDEKVIALDKPSGMLVHPVRLLRPRAPVPDSVPVETLVDWLRRERPEVGSVGDDPLERPGIVHRLDRDTSGVLLIPKTQEYFLYLKHLFAQGEVRKTYLALVRGVPNPPEGVIDAPISIRSGSVRRTVHRGKKTQEAVTAYRLLERYALASGEECALLEVSPRTGRTHQIRVHLASVHHAIAGDPLYGPKQPLRCVTLSRQFLHAHAVTFPLEPGRVVTIVSDLPPDLAGVLRDLRAQNRQAS